ncbi:MAG: RNA polymerase sigma factor [Armatimonadota bacterium]
MSRPVKIYTEAGFARKLSDERRFLPRITPPTAVRWLAEELLRGQLMDLLEGLPVGERCRQVARLRLDGYTVREIAGLLGITRQAVEWHWARLNELLRPGLAMAEARMEPGRVPWYGWQEVYLESIRRKP